jgi:quercetin 2,3-dioxygenase
VWQKHFNVLVYVLSGRGHVGPEGHPISSGQLAVLGSGDRITVSADQVQDSNRTTALDVLILGGQPIREPVVQHGPFVMNSRAEVIEALQDYEAGKFGSIPPNALKPYLRGGTT